MDFATGPLGTLLTKLGQLLQNEYNLQKGVKKDIQFVTRELESMHAALRDVGEVPHEQLKEVVKIWARDVRELSYDMEDIVDSFLVRVQGSEPPSKRSIKRFIKEMTSIMSNTRTRHEIGQEIKDIKERVKEVAERRDRYKVDAITPNKTSVDPRITALYTKAASLVGVDEPRKMLISRLTKEDGGMSSAQQRIVSIVGFGGLGKTTLAKAVYDKIKPQFNCTAFVSVSRDPDITKVFKDILYELDKKEYKDIHNSALGQQHLIDLVQQFLENKRYFVVVDDIWEPQSWEPIKFALVENNCGSRIIITTRKAEVAKKGDEVYKLEPLSQDSSKKLFYTRLFGCEDKSPTNHEVELSDMILKKCGGVPLAIITMASLLLGKSRNEWIEVCKSPGFNQHNDDQQMENTMHILSLSYYDLPSHLKTCLLYLSVFPEDTLIDKYSLIWKWIGEGFVKKKNGLSLFEVGEEYFHDLINRNLIHAVDSKVYGIIDGCRVHDMVLDLIVSMSQEENFVCVGGTLSQSSAHRLVQTIGELDLTGDSCHGNLPPVRSFIVWRCEIVKWALHPRLKLIRLLALEDCTFSEGCHSLEHIGNLHHLRYLRISGKQIPKLSEEIGSLNFLQTLDLNVFGDLELELPYSIGNLTQLVCLRASGTIVPVGVVGKLTALEELQIGGYYDSEEFKRKFMKDLGNLTKLRVLKLHIWSWNMDDRMVIDLTQSLGNLKKMQHLIVRYRGIANMNAWDATVPSGDLRCLFFGPFHFPKLPSWISSAHLASLSYLVICVMDVDENGLKALGGLPMLCYLKLVVLEGPEITLITNADGCFQKLRSLALPNSMVQFVANEDDSTGSRYRGMASGKCQKKDNSRVVIMPRLEELQFCVNVEQLMQNKDVTCGHLGLEYLPSICKVTVDFDCYKGYWDEAQRETAALRHAIEVHPNRPALQIEFLDTYRSLGLS